MILQNSHLLKLVRRASRDYYVLLPKPSTVVIDMDTKKAAARSEEEKIANVGVHECEYPPHDNEVPPKKAVSMGDQVLVVPP